MIYIAHIGVTVLLLSQYIIYALCTTFKVTKDVGEVMKRCDIYHISCLLCLPFSQEIDLFVLYTIANSSSAHKTTLGNQFAWSGYNELLICAQNPLFRHKQYTMLQKLLNRLHKTSVKMFFRF